MKFNSLLSVTLALVLVAGLGTPAFADDRDHGESTLSLSAAEIEELLTPFSDDDVIYENGDPDLDNSEFIDNRIRADDFVLDGDFVVTDAHFIVEKNDSPLGIDPLFYAIYADAGGFPGDELASGIAQDLQLTILVDNPIGDDDVFEAWFDFEEGVPLEGGVTYWFALTYKVATFAVEDPEPEWIEATAITGNPSLEADEFPPVWDSPDNFDVWFQLTGDVKVVGGEFLPIDSTTLVLAGLQSSAIWMLPVIVSVLGIGLFVVSRKSNNS